MGALLVDRFSDLTALGAQTSRISQLRAQIHSTPSSSNATVAIEENVGLLVDDDSNEYTYKHGDCISVEDLSYRVPNNGRMLAHNLNLVLSAEGIQSILVTGPSGTGKSSLLRVLAGLWTDGVQGSITMPDPNSVSFMPQKPYLTCGSLRDQLLFPRNDTNLSDEKLWEALKQ